MTASSTGSTLEDQLHILRTEYGQHLPQQVEQIEVTLTALLRGAWSTASASSLRRTLHTLAGSSTTFGYPALGDAAHALELWLHTILASGGPPAAAQRAYGGTLLDTLKSAAAQPGQGTRASSLEQHVPSVHSPVHDHSNRLIFLVEDDLHLARDLAGQIGHFGYTVRIFGSLDGLKQAVVHTPPAAMIVDMMLPEGDLAGGDIIADLQHGRETPLPVIFMSARADLTARLQAVRASGVAYFVKPINISGLIDTLDRLTARQAPDPYRILIVDDQRTLALRHQLVLQQAGMTTAVVTDPMQVLQPLVEFRPDLILMDMYMPGCTGMELAAVIRQQEAYVSIPIVFLSAETNRDTQLAAMRLGGDDFLTKSVQPDHLISSITSRAQRARILRSFMTRDSLTGLLNHTATREQLEIELVL